MVVIDFLLPALLNGINYIIRAGKGASNFLYAYILAAVFGIYVGISETLQRAVIPRYISSELLGTAYGLYNVVLALASL
jgi:hypothetical protein